MSIIVPVYQAGRYLERLLDSIVCQCGGDIEVLLIDDGSTDNGPLICDDYARRYEFVRTFHKENGGVSSARNYGLKKATGKYILFADADDEYAAGAITQIREKCLSGGWDLMIFSHCQMCQDNSGNCIIQRQGTIPVQTLKNDSSRFLCDICVNPVWNKVFVRRIIKSYDLRFPDMRIGEDAFFSYSYLECCNTVYFEQKVFYLYYQNESSAVHSFCPSRWEDESRLIGLCEELALKWDYSSDQAEEMTANRYRNALLYELYNVLSADCPMKLLQKAGYLHKLLHTCREKNWWNLISGDGLDKAKKIQLWMLKHHALLPLLCLMEGKRVLTAEKYV